MDQAITKRNAWSAGKLGVLSSSLNTEFIK